jgi:uncharacterized protein
LLENPNLNINTALAQKYESCIGDTESGVKQTMDRPKYMDEYYKAKKESNDYRVSCQDYGVTQTLQNAIKTDSLINYKSTFCAAHANMKIFDALGDIYACWDVIGMEDHKIGSYKENVDLHNDAYDMWVTRNISNIKSCSKCKYALFCGGGCAGQLALRGIEITKSNCENFPQVFSKIANEIYDTEIVKKLNQ